MSAHRADICIAAIADTFACDAEILASPMGFIPSLGAQLARRTQAPQLMMTDGVASLVNIEGVTEAHLPYHEVFHLLWSTKRHVMMGASQLDAYGNQNISCIGPYKEPKAMLIGCRGAPGNTLYHRTSYWLPKQSARILCEQVDVVCGVGNDRAAELPPRTRRYHDVHRVVSNLAVFGFNDQGRLTILSVHPGVEPTEVHAACSFELNTEPVPVTRQPSEDELRILAALDPEEKRYKEVPE